MDTKNWLVLVKAMKTGGAMSSPGQKERWHTGRTTDGWMEKTTFKWLRNNKVSYVQLTETCTVMFN